MRLAFVTPTHDARWLPWTWKSLKAQLSPDWKWYVYANGANAELVAADVKRMVGDDPRVQIRTIAPSKPGVGAAKKLAFADAAAESDVVVELDHDDLLMPTAAGELEKAFTAGADFAYSDFIDFATGDVEKPVTYRTGLEAWKANGWEFYSEPILPEMVDLMVAEAERATLPLPTARALNAGVSMLAARSFAPSAAAFSLIYYAPNHVRAWRSSVYLEIGGHSEDYPVCDDHELLIRTFLKHGVRIVRIPKPLYLYRVTGENTWSARVDEIRRLTYALQAKHLHELVLAECKAKGLPAYDLGGDINNAPGWVPVDQDNHVGYDNKEFVCADLSYHWPFETGSVGAFRASDFLEHLPDKEHAMREIHRCLAPGGWLLSFTPSALGQGGACDPTHKSLWVRRSFDYYTKRETAKYIRNDSMRFMAVRHFEGYPSDWHAKEDLKYVVFDGVKLEDPAPRPPGEIFI